MTTRVVNLRRHENYNVYIGRGGPGRSGYFGNPFPIGGIDNKTRAESIVEFECYFHDRLQRDPEFKRRVEELRGRTLGCFCAPLPCHGDVIVAYLEYPP